MAPSGSGSKKARASERSTSDRVSQMRKEQQKKDRRRLLAIWGAAAVTIAIVIGAVAFAVINDKATPRAWTRSRTSPTRPARTPSPAVTYKENPPVGGEHHPGGSTAASTTSRSRNENAVHSIEHGAVWITYKPDLPAADVDAAQGRRRRTRTRVLSPVRGPAGARRRLRVGPTAAI